MAISGDNLFLEDTECMLSLARGAKSFQDAEKQKYACIDGPR